MSRRVLFRLLLVGALLFGFTWAADDAPPPTRIKKKDGTVVMGEIKGVFVQGQAAEVKGGGYGALLYIREGSTIAHIDENGVQYRKGVSVRYVNIGQKKPVNLLAVASMVAAMDGGNFMAMMEYSSRHDSAAVNTDFLVPDGTVKLPVLGEFRTDKAGDKLMPALEIVTEAGTRVIPLEEIMPFKTTDEPNSR